MRVDGRSFESLVEQLLGEGRSVTLRAFGESMMPSVPSGSVLTVVPATPRRIRRGDVVLFQNHRGSVHAHRFVRGVRREGLDWIETWGDGRAAPDAPVPACRLLGKVTRVVVDDRPLLPVFWGPLAVRRLWSRRTRSTIASRRDAVLTAVAQLVRPAPVVPGLFDD